MVRDYTRQLYAPAATTGRAMNADYAGARELAAWKQRVKAGWDAVRVEHVDSSGVGDAPELGAALSVHAFVSLGSLTPDDVQVQVVHGRADSEDLLTDATTAPLSVAESYEGGRYRFDGEVRLARSGTFGYTVRVVPLNLALDSVAELGLVATA